MKGHHRTATARHMHSSMPDPHQPLDLGLHSRRKSRRNFLCLLQSHPYSPRLLITERVASDVSSVVRGYLPQTRNRKSVRGPCVGEGETRW
jgi:hypothetical protein